MSPGNISIKMGEGIVIGNPGILSSTGIGSCVVVMIYDFHNRIGGMAHVMLPDSKYINVNCYPYQYADTAIIALLGKLVSRGGSRERIVAKIVGGAQMFKCSSDLGPGIGKQNVLSIRRLLNREQIRLVGEDVGGRRGRNVDFYLDSGRVIVKTTGKKEEIEL
jgi:chemotaxis protein CheD